MYSFGWRWMTEWMLQNNSVSNSILLSISACLKLTTKYYHKCPYIQDDHDLHFLEKQATTHSNSLLATVNNQCTATMKLGCAPLNPNWTHLQQYLHKWDIFGLLNDKNIQIFLHVSNYECLQMNLNNWLDIS